MSPTTFEELAQLVAPRLMRESFRHDVLTVGEILGATLRYLATGESMMDITYAFRMGKSTVSKIIVQCCNAIWDILKDKVLIQQNTYGWLTISNEFESKWQMPNCVGALDGKHIIHQAFPNGGSTNYNYKGTHSTILLALCDANYNFTYVNIGMPGRCSDGGVLKSCELGKQILSNGLGFPEASPISETSGNIPYFIVADEAFPLLTSMMRPYPGRGKQILPINKKIFNYRLSRARRCIENCFGILASRWRVYRQTIIASEETVNAIIKATVVLHNFVKNKETEYGLLSHNYSVNDEVISHQRTSRVPGLMPVSQMGSNFYDQSAKDIRTKLTEYFSNEGAVPFQYNYV
ncbi:unnamed protein product [Macrosiphum euphorbiae]|nr:unnamed protein product [Macrosiphum euphorbiae]